MNATYYKQAEYYCHGCKQMIKGSCYLDRAKTYCVPCYKKIYPKFQERKYAQTEP